jgi:hypothetical protein
VEDQVHDDSITRKGAPRFLKTLLILHLLWAVCFATVSTFTAEADIGDRILAAVCYGWVAVALGLIFKKRWGWWGSLVCLVGASCFLMNGTVHSVFDALSAATASPGDEWLGAAILLTCILLTCALIVALVRARAKFGVVGHVRLRLSLVVVGFVLLFSLGNIWYLRRSSESGRIEPDELTFTDVVSSGDQGSTNSRWVRVEFKMGGFSVAMPSRPKPGVQTTETLQGLLTVYTATAEVTGNLAYMSGFADFPKEYANPQVSGY